MDRVATQELITSNANCRISRQTAFTYRSTGLAELAEGMPMDHSRQHSRRQFPRLAATGFALLTPNRMLSSEYWQASLSAIEGTQSSGMSSDSSEQQTQITQLIERLGNSPGSLGRLAEAVYEDIHRLAHFQRYQMQAGETLRTTALVNEAFLKVFREDGEASIANRQHLMRLMAMAIRQIIVDHARRQLAQKRGGDVIHVELDEGQVAASQEDAARVLDMEAAVQRLTDMDEKLGDLVAARFFAGYSTDELAELAGVSRRTVQRQLQRANAWLRFELEQAE
jgi:RNA polymerase sigma factor (TIGR02999 family)